MSIVKSKDAALVKVGDTLGCGDSLYLVLELGTGPRGGRRVRVAHITFMEYFRDYITPEQIGDRSSKWNQLRKNGSLGPAI